MEPRSSAWRALLLLAALAAPARAHDPVPIASDAAGPLTARELRASMLESDSVQVSRIAVDFAPATADTGAPRRWTTHKLSLANVRGPWLQRFTVQVLPAGSVVRTELCPTPRPLPGQPQPWLMSVLWIDGVRSRGQVYVDLANLCGLAGLMGRQPVGLDVAPERVDSLFALFQQALPGDSALRAMAPPAPAPTAGGPDQPPQPTVRVQPVYPDSARKAGIGGTVRVRALVDVDGTVREAHVTDGVFGLDDAAVAAVRQWRFRPALHAGVPVASWAVVPVRFSLQPPPAPSP